MDISEGMQMAHEIGLPLSPLWLYREMGTSAVLLSVSTWKFPNSILSGSLVECMYIVVFGGFGHTVSVCKGREPGSYNTVSEVTLVVFCCWVTIIYYTLFHSWGLSSWEKALTVLCSVFLNSLQRFSVVPPQLFFLSNIYLGLGRGKGEEGKKKRVGGGRDWRVLP